MKAVAVYFGDEWNAGQRFICEQFPTEHDSSSGTRTSAVMVETELQRVVDYKRRLHFISIVHFRHSTNYK